MQGATCCRVQPCGPARGPLQPRPPPEMRCSVPSTPARLSPPKSPSAASAWARSSLVICGLAGRGEGPPRWGTRGGRGRASSGAGCCVRLDRARQEVGGASPAASPAGAGPGSGGAHLSVPQELAARLAQEARLWAPAQVQHHLQQRGALRVVHQRLADVSGQHLQAGASGRGGAGAMLRVGGRGQARQGGVILLRCSTCRCEGTTEGRG